MANQHGWTTTCLRLAAAAPEPKLQKVFLRMARSLQVDAVLLAMSRSTIAESWRLLETLRSQRALSNGRHDSLLEHSRTSIAQSKQLLATVENSPSTAVDAAAPGEPTLAPAAPIAADAGELGAEADHNPAALSVLVFQNGARFSWIVCSPDEEILGRGTAETELKARADAFRAGVTYLDWLKDRPASGDTSLH